MYMYINKHNERHIKQLNRDKICISMLQCSVIHFVFERFGHNKANKHLKLNKNYFEEKYKGAKFK